MWDAERPEVAEVIAPKLSNGIDRRRLAQDLNVSLGFCRRYGLNREQKDVGAPDCAGVEPDLLVVRGVAIEPV